MEKERLKPRNYCIYFVDGSVEVVYGVISASSPEGSKKSGWLFLGLENNDSYEFKVELIKYIHTAYLER